jgi:heme A synthase
LQLILPTVVESRSVVAGHRTRLVNASISAKVNKSSSVLVVRLRLAARALDVHFVPPLGLSVSTSRESRMPVWKVLFIVVLFCACLALGSATLVYPMTSGVENKWLWLVGLFLATVLMGTLFTLYLRKAGADMGR